MDPGAAFVKGWFRRYYSTSPVEPPPRFGKREFGFMFFGGNFMMRHMGFPRAADLSRFLMDRVPMHAYHSTAYYQTPSAPTMAEKGWLGADLIFDLDADHLEGAEDMSYGEMLDRIKVEFIKLLDDFLFGDLGFDPKNVRIVFSGGRGYHAHISDPRVLSLGSHERREVVDFVTSNGLDMDWAVRPVVTMTKEFRDVRKVYMRRDIPPPDAGGWRRRVRLGLEGLLDTMELEGPAELRERYPSLEGVSNRVIGNVRRELFDDPRGGRRILESGNLEAAGSERNQRVLLDVLGKDIVPSMAGEVDEPVTSDVKRLIRLPYSLHGKSSLMVTPLTRESLDDFDPLRDAIVPMFPDDPVNVLVPERTEVRFAGERTTLEGEVEVSTAMAIFLLCRRSATLVPFGDTR